MGFSIPFKPIETTFNSVKFRSRLEARWAVFLAELNIKWEYEYEGYNLDGVYYLPDFYLPLFNGGAFIEVKPLQFSNNEDFKVYRLCELTGHPVVKAVGSPDLIFYEIYFKQGSFVDLLWSNFNLDWRAIRDQRFWVEPSAHEWEIDKFWCPELAKAVLIAKSYRF